MLLLKQKALPVERKINMKKKLILIALMLCVVLSVTSCFETDAPSGDDGPVEQTNTLTVFSPTSAANIVTAGIVDDDVTSAAEMLSDAIKSIGVKVNYSTDVYAVKGVKIIIGNTPDAATAAAVADVEKMSLADDEEAFVIRTSGGSVAIYATDGACYSRAISYFIVNYLKSTTLELEDNKLLYSAKIPHSEFEDESDELAWEQRWSTVEARFGNDVASSLRQIYSFYGSSVYMWIANLYDVEHGGFYYANSARDYDGFLPDIESTTQALWLITASGLTKHLNNDLTVALPTEVVEKTLEFVYGLYDDSDGYFYHEQWGKNIGSSRKGRDINSALDVINKLGGTIPENHALNRLQNGTAGTVSMADAVSKVVMVSSVKPVSFLSSKGELISWLEGLKINTDSHNAGHTIESVSSQILAAGYASTVIDWLDSKQYDTGLWQDVDPKNPYMALSGLLKIGSCYSKLGGQMKHCDNMIDTAIDVILSDVDPVIVIYVYNPWGGLKYALSAMISANKAAEASGKSALYDYDAAFAKVLARFPEMIDVTIDKLSKFQKADGSFSYYQEVSAAYTQGTHVSLGLREGDVNGTSLGMTTMYTTFYEILGTSVVPLYNVDDYEAFIGELNVLEPISKKPRPDFEPVDFENGEMTVYLSKYSTKAGSTIEIIDDGDGNNALHIDSPSGVGDQITFKSDAVVDGMASFAFEFDMRIDKGAAYSHQISLLNSGGSIATMLTVRTSGNTISFQDTTSNMHDIGAVVFTETAKIGEWFHVRMEYHYISEDKAVFVLYINGEYAGESTNFYGKYDANGNLTAATYKNNIDRLQVYIMGSAVVDCYYDNFDYEFSQNSEYAE